MFGGQNGIDRFVQVLGGVGIDYVLKADAGSYLRAGFKFWSTKTAPFPVVSELPQHVGVGCIGIAARCGVGGRGDRNRQIGIGSLSRSTTAPRPAARDQRPRRGRVRLRELERFLGCPRHGRCCRCATGAAALISVVIAVPSLPSEAKGEEGTEMLGEEVENN